MMVDKESLVEQIKTLQRTDKNAKVAWQEHCMNALGGKCDPARHEESELEEFLAWWHESGNIEGKVTSEPMVPPATKLVEQIKALQRSDQNAKLSWQKHCDDFLGGIKDPGRHDESVLKEFLTLYKGDGEAAAPPAPSLASPAHAIKCLAKVSPAFMAAWKTYCKAGGETFTDPAKHTEVFVKEFLEFAAQSIQAELSDGKGSKTETPAAELDANIGDKRPAVSSDDPPAKLPRLSEPDSQKKKVTMKRAVADKIRELNETGRFTLQIRPGVVAAKLADVGEAQALGVLESLELQEQETVGDPNAFINDAAEALLAAAED